VQETTGRKAGH